MRLFYKNFIKNISLSFFAIVLLMVFVVSLPPSDFPEEQFDFHVSENSSLSYISNKLAKDNVISSPFLFKVAVVLTGGQRGLFAGDYRFTESQNIFMIARRMVKGIQGLPKVRITIPEGTNVYEMAYIYMQKLPNFNAPRFVALALKNEGYLFPDTYNFLSNVKAEEIIKTMRNNFNEKTKPLDAEITSSKRLFQEIIIMASIVEEEANSDEDRRAIAGILWKRLDTGMALQVDAPFYYITGKRGAFTYDDLKIDSPYNTYMYKGLPKGPISNPGLKSIEATLSPLSTTHFYYLTGNDGITRYADTYDGHLRNKNVYLK